MKIMRRKYKPKLLLERTDRIAVVGAAIAAAAAGYLMWKRWRIPMQERYREVADVPPVEASLSDEDFEGERDIMMPSEGEGPVYHRRYRIDLRNSTETPASLMAHIQSDIQRFAPPELANFEKTRGDAAKMQEGDEYYIHILGPWDGPVRVIDVGETHFTLITLKPHFEAGQICFRTMPSPTQPDGIRFEIESWARSRDAQVAFAYEDAKVAQKAQTGMWVWFCNQVGKACGGEQIGKIDVLTEKAPFRGEFIAYEP